MATIVTDYEKWLRAAPSRGDANLLSSLFRRQNKGIKLSDKELNAVEQAHLSLAHSNPLFIANRSHLSGKMSRRFESASYGLTTLARPDDENPLMPGKDKLQDLAIVGEHKVVTARKHSFLRRTLPIIIRNERIETDHLRQTAHLIDYRSVDTERAIGLSFLMTQAYQDLMEKEALSHDIPALIPYGRGFLKAHLQENALRTRCQSMDLSGDDRLIIKELSDEEPRFLMTLEAFRAPALLTPAEEMLFKVMKDRFGDDATLKMLRQLIDDYITGLSMEQSPHSAEHSQLISDMKILLNDPLWLQSTHKTPMTYRQSPSRFDQS